MRLAGSELGVEPSSETISLYEQIREGEITKKERVTRRGVLPAQLTSFIGREIQITEVVNLMESHRLVTITGPGGIGKTRLGLQVARQLEESYRNGAWWVELAPVSDLDLVPETVVRALGIHLESRVKALSSLQFFLEERHLLLVLDNCEHLVEALLRTCPDLSILATSREVLGVGGESIYSLLPMTLPAEDEILTQENLEAYEALGLFIGCARVVSPNFQSTGEKLPVIAQICRQLDGIPLAIELAVARTRMMGIEEIALRLEDRFYLLRGGSRTALPRHQTLRACIDWSYELLTEEERLLLQRLSVFAGRWTLAGAEYFCPGDGIESNQVLDLLAELVNKSLVTTAQDADIGTQYRMLETIRQYAHEKLVEAGGLPTARDRHLEYYVTFGERMEKVIRGPEQGTILRRLEAELDDIRLAFTWSLQDEGDQCWKIEYGMRLGAALLWFWHIRSREEDGYHWMEQLLDRDVETRQGKFIEASALQAAKMVRAKALMVASWLSRRTRQSSFADMITESRDLYLELDSVGRLGYARTLFLMAVYDLNDGKLRQADEYLRESLAILQEEDDKFWQSEALELMGELASVNQEFKQASSHYKSALALSHEIDDLDGIAWHLYKIAVITMEQTPALDHEIIEQIRDLLAESLKTFLKGENIPTASRPMIRLGDLDWRQGNYHRASMYFNQALSYGEKHGDLNTIHSSLSRLASLALSQGDYQQAVDLFNQKMKISLKRDHKLYIADSLLDLGDLDWVLGEYEPATRKYETALKVFQENNWKSWEAISLFCLGRISLLRGEFRLARGYLDDAFKMSKKFAMNDWENKIIEVIAIQASNNDESVRAAHLFGATATWHASWHLTRWLKERQERERAIAVARQALGEEAFKVAWEEGAAMSLEQSVDYARGDEDV